MRELSKRSGAGTIPRARAVEHTLRGERHDAGMAIVGLHELLDPEGHAVDEAELLRNVFLVPKRQPVLLASCA